MQDLSWSSALPSGSLDEGVKLLKSLHWNISVEQHNGTWIVSAGEKILLKTSSKDSVEAFLYGLALAHSTLPKHILRQLQHLMDNAVQ